MAELVISLCKDIAPLRRITNLINTYIDDQYEYQIGRDVKGKLQQMGESLTKIKAVLEVAEKMEIEDNHSLVEWLSKLKNAIYNAEYVMDVFEYERLKNEVEGWPKTTTTEVVDDKGSLLTKVPRLCHNMISASSSKIQESASVIAKRLVFADEDFNNLLRVADKFDKLAKETNTLITLLQLYRANQVMQPTFAAAEKVPDSRVTSSVPLEPKLYGREATQKRLLELLLQDSNESRTRSFSVVSVVGVGGIGKTTLAQFVFNHQSLKDKFDIKAWVCVSNDFSIERLLKNILEVATGVKKTPDFNTYTTFQKLQETLMNVLGSRRFFIVLDDVWEDMEGKWATIQETFSTGTMGSKILITSRIHNVARAMGSQEELQIKLDSLKFEDFLPFFQQCAFRNEDSRNNVQLKHIGEEIAQKLGGLPLAAKVVGGLLYQNLNINYWKQVINSKRWKERDDKLLPALKLSYDHLPQHLKKCFVYCCLFPKDYEYDAATLRDIWVALSCIRLEDKDKRLVDIETEYVNELVNRSFLDEQRPTGSAKVKTYVIHDLLHDMAEKIVGDEVYRIENVESLSKEIPCNIRHLYIKSTYKGLGLVLPKIAPKQLQSLVYVVADVGRDLKLPRETIINIEGLRYLAFKAETFSYLEMQFLKSLGDMKHLLCANFAFGNSLYDGAIFHISNLWKPYQLKILQSQGIKGASKDCHNLYKLINLRVVQLDHNCHFMTPYLSRLKSLEMASECTFNVDGKDGNDIGQLGELNNIGGKLILMITVKYLSEEEATKAFLNRKQYLVNLNISGNIEDEALEALEPHTNLEELNIKESRNITTAPKWLHILSSLTTLVLHGLPNVQGLDPDLGRHLVSLETLMLYSIPLVRQIEVIPSGPVFPSLVHVELWDMENMEGWSIQSCKQDSSICFPKLSEIWICNCPKLLKSGGSFPDCIMCPFPSSNCNISLILSNEYYSKLEEAHSEGNKMQIDEESLRPAIDDVNDPKNNMLFRCVDEFIIIGHTIPATLINKFSSLETLKIQVCNSIGSLDDIAHHLLPCAVNTLKITHCGNFKLLSAANSLQTIFPSLETLIIEDCFRGTIDINNENHISLISTSVKTLVIKESGEMKFLPIPILFPFLQTLIIEDCWNLLSLHELNDDHDRNELPPSINTLIIKLCPKLKLSGGTLQMLPSIEHVEIKKCEEITRQQKQHNKPSE